MRQPDSQTTRTKITLVAFDLFANRGYKGTSMQDVADAVGLKKPNVFYYFETKEVLALSVIDHLRLQIKAYLETYGQSPSPSIKGLLLQIGSSADQQDPIRAWSAISSEMASANSQLQESVRETLDMWHQEVVKIVQLSGSTDPEQDATTAWAVIAFWQGATSLERDAGSKDLKAQGAKLVAEFLGDYR
jgi:TetR/AcrR family transcriptional regulator, transcriptional repressor for nem operon